MRISEDGIEREHAQGENAEAPPHYRDLKRQFKEAKDGNFVIMPLWPYGPTNDNIPAVAIPLSIQDGIVMSGGKPYSGLASTVYDLAKPEQMQCLSTAANHHRTGPMNWPAA
mgnify:CR=1 FL=1